MITPRCIVDGQIDVELANHISEEDYNVIIKRSYVHKYDVIMPTIGTIGNPVLIETDQPIALKNVAIFHTNGSEMLGKYIKYLLDSTVVKTQFDLDQYDGTKDFVTQETLKNLTVPFPARLNEVVSFLDEKCSWIDSIIREKQALICELESYKKSLVYEVVTGKRRVC